MSQRCYDFKLPSWPTQRFSWGLQPLCHATCLPLERAWLVGSCPWNLKEIITVKGFYLWIFTQSIQWLTPKTEPKFVVSDPKTCCSCWFNQSVASFQSPCWVHPMSARLANPLVVLLAKFDPLFHATRQGLGGATTFGTAMWKKEQD